MAADPIKLTMYDAGFGDCFLLVIPSTDGLRKVLIDCGSIKKGKEPFGKVVEKVIEDIRDDDGVARLDVVIATHRHRDHVSGFADAAWADVEVREVWLPWTEDNDDPDAVRIREHQLSLAKRLERALTFLPADQGLADLTMNALSNDAAMATLRDGFANHKETGKRPQRRYLPDKQLSRTLVSDALPGVDIHVLGPSRARGDIAYMEPRADDEHYLRLAGDPLGDNGDDAPGSLFSSDWSDEAPPLYALDQDEASRIESMGAGLETMLASWLDGALNNTSIMVVLKVGQAHLLLPGDSQWGTWMRVLGDAQWRSLLSRTTVYKVGHHGSYNATPPDFAERVLNEEALSVVSVIPHGSYSQVPKDGLLTELAKKSRVVVRSDDPGAGAPGFERKVRAGFSVQFEIPTS